MEGQFDLIINWLMAAFNSSTGHTHSGSGNNGPLLSSSAVTTTFGNGFTTVTGASGDYLLIASDVSDSNKTKKALASDFIFTPSASNALSGSVVQVVSNIGQSTFGKSANLAFGAVDSGTTTIPFDDTIPQNTEGDQYMQLSITPTSATNKLIIDVNIVLANGITGTSELIAALFQDSTANALASAWTTQATSFNGSIISFSYYMTSGTTSSTTFKVRAGSDSSGTTTFNGTGGSRKLGGVSASSMTITEIKV